MSRFNRGHAPSRFVLFLLIVLVLLVLGTGIETSAASSSLLLEDDFSTDKGWVDESGGFIYRDASNEWLILSGKPQYPAPSITCLSTPPRILSRSDFRFNTTSCRRQRECIYRSG